MSVTHCFQTSETAEIETTVITHESAHDEALTSVLYEMTEESHDRTNVVGFGIEKSFTSSENDQFVTEKVAVLKLCVGNYCLIVNRTAYSFHEDPNFFSQVSQLLNNHFGWYEN
ncbi:hypothetical protein L484_018760 [Morus notabilis]|uniref:Uncharacterized protein n=1 Tax=Morus notabilis TaxID=981085 RepID=W9QW60_9ROSA|nr:hypothetical protein L484_018760 [Morus notabilis]